MSRNQSARDERLALRKLAQTVPCPVCAIEAGLPCIGFEGQPNGRMDHVKRIEVAKRIAAERATVTVPASSAPLCAPDTAREAR